MLRRDALRCNDPECPISCAVIAPLVTDERGGGRPGGVRAPTLRRRRWCARPRRSRRWVSGQVELAELAHGRGPARSRPSCAHCARRSSPHFVYNSLAAIASFVRTDPERARELLLEFADFTRYAFRGRRRVHHAGGRAAQRSSATWRWSRPGSATGWRCPLLIAPEVLPVAVPFLSHPAAGGERRPARAGGQAGAGPRSRSPPTDEGTEAGITVEDDGVGVGPRGDPARARRRRPTRRTASDWATSTPGCGQAFGDDYGLVVETAVGAGHQGQRSGCPSTPRACTRPSRLRAFTRPGRALRRTVRLCRQPPPDRPTLRVLVVDDEAPRAVRAGLPAAQRRPRSATCTSPAPAPRRCGRWPSDTVDVVFCDIKMPGHGRARPGPGARASSPTAPQVVFVTAYDEHAVDAFELRAIDYVMKPVRAGGWPRRSAGSPTTAGRRRDGAGPTTRRSRSSSAASRASSGARTCATSRRRATTPGCTPRDGGPPRAHPARRRSRSAGRAAGFVRIHRSTLVALRAHRRGAVRRTATTRCGSAAAYLPVSRRHARELRERLLATRADPTELRRR